MKISIVIPCKNQTETCFENIEKIGLPYFESLGLDFEFLVVLDGSDDKNVSLAEMLIEKFDEHVKILPYEKKFGKGHNVKHGFLEADGDYVLFMDADFATDLHIMEDILPHIGEHDGFIASRRCKGAKIATKQTLKRRFVSWVSRIMIRTRFHLGYSETQCGFKLFRKDLAKTLAKHQIIDGFAFDVEYLYFCHLNGFDIKEVPCVWNDGEKSTINNATKASMDFIGDMKRIKKNKKNYILSVEEKESLKRKGA